MRIHCARWLARSASSVPENSRLVNTNRLFLASSSSPLLDHHRHHHSRVGLGSAAADSTIPQSIRKSCLRSKHSEGEEGRKEGRKEGGGRPIESLSSPVRGHSQRVHSITAEGTPPAPVVWPVPMAVGERKTSFGRVERCDYECAALGDPRPSAALPPTPPPGGSVSHSLTHSHETRLKQHVRPRKREHLSLHSSSTQNEAAPSPTDPSLEIPGEK